MSSLTHLPSLALALLAVVSTSFLPCCSQCLADEAEPWSYRGSQNGVDQWQNLPGQCGGKNQSPIDLSRCKRNRDLKLLSLSNYDLLIRNATMMNMGYTVQLMLNDNVARTIDVEDKKYNLVQIHFHWSFERNKGSEHTLKGRAYEMEVHFVHSNNNSLAVVGVLIEEHKSKENKGLLPIVDSLSDVLYKNDRTILKLPLVLNELLPKDTASFYRYYGSLTTPDCAEGVIWSVMRKRIRVSKEQMKAFRNLRSVTKENKDGNEDCLIAPNYRPPQPLNNREVYCP